MNVKKKNLKILLAISIVIGLIVPVFIMNFGNAYTPQTLNTSTLNASDGTFTRDNFDPQINSPKQGLGNISVTDIDFEEDGFSFISNIGYNELFDDLTGSDWSTGDEVGNPALNISYKTTEFYQNVQPALVQNLNESIKDKEKITIEINESISVQFNQSQSYEVEGYMIYTPRLTPCTFKELHIRENQTESSEPLNEGNYSIDDYNFMKFSYDKYFDGDETGNFTLHMIWEYTIDVNEWKLAQEQSESLELDSKNNTVQPDFNYEFTILGQKKNGSKLEQIPADNLDINATLNLPDMALLNYTAIQVNGEGQDEEDVENPDHSLQMVLNASNSQVEVNFNAEFGVEFQSAIKNSWAIDRLVSSKNVRERIFFPSIISGPKQIFVKNLIAYDESINYDQVTKNSTQFGRSISYYRANITVVEEEMQNSLIFTENTTKQKGLKLILPYLIRGETCPSLIRYRPTKNLRIIITDNSFMPLANAEIKLYYNGQEFGTYISKDRTQPLPKKLTDGEGEVIIDHVPNGNYTLKVIRDNNVIHEATISPENEISYVRTNVPHFPVLGMIFGIVSLSLFLLGFVLYKKNKEKER
ncbi:MAG: hypothetical protein R6U96_10540 [Promethearchaeia archaeon]